MAPGHFITSPVFPAPITVLGVSVCCVGCARSAGCAAQVAVHCHAGYGRTGILIACILVHRLGLNAEAAINTVRQRRPKCIQNPKQARFVESFAQMKLIPDRMFTSSTAPPRQPQQTKRGVVIVEPPHDLPPSLVALVRTLRYAATTIPNVVAESFLGPDWTLAHAKFLQGLKAAGARGDWNQWAFLKKLILAAVDEEAAAPGGSLGIGGAPLTQLTDAAEEPRGRAGSAVNGPAGPVTGDRGGSNTEAEAEAGTKEPVQNRQGGVAIEVAAKNATDAITQAATEAAGKAAGSEPETPASGSTISSAATPSPGGARLRLEPIHGASPPRPDLGGHLGTGTPISSDRRAGRSTSSSAAPHPPRETVVAHARDLGIPLAALAESPDLMSLTVESLNAPLPKGWHIQNDGSFSNNWTGQVVKDHPLDYLYREKAQSLMQTLGIAPTPGPGPGSGPAPDVSTGGGEEEKEGHEHSVAPNSTAGTAGAASATHVPPQQVTFAVTVGVQLLLDWLEGSLCPVLEPTRMVDPLTSLIPPVASAATGENVDKFWVSFLQTRLLSICVTA